MDYVKLYEWQWVPFFSGWLSIVFLFYSVVIDCCSFRSVGYQCHSFPVGFVQRLPPLLSPLLAPSFQAPRLFFLAFSWRLRFRFSFCVSNLFVPLALYDTRHVQTVNDLLVSIIRRTLQRWHWCVYCCSNVLLVLSQA